MKSKSLLKKVFYSLIIIFVLLIGYFAIPFPEEIKQKLFLITALLGLIFLILGIWLVFLAKKEKGKLKFFLILTGISTIGPLIFSILHNVFYGLEMVVNVSILKSIFEGLHVASFFIALVVSPITFLIGVIGSIVIFIKKK